MDTLQAIILGILQGATEFLPVSSSGHLVLVPWLLGWPAPALVFDTVLHLGTLLAVVVFFWRDIWNLIRGVWLWLRGQRPASNDARLAGLLVLGTIPAAVMGVVGESYFEELFSAPAWVAGFLLITALILAVSEKLGRRQKETLDLTVVDALLIGLAQGFAIAPGISRSGATIAMGLFLGLRRPAAARYSFLLSIPIILGAGGSQLLKTVLEPAGEMVPWGLLGAGFLAAAIVGYLCIRFLMSYLQRGRLYLFSAYCALAGLGGLAVAFLR